MQSQKIQTWKTSDGREIPLNEMTDTHLDNAIAYIERRVIQKKQELVAALEKKIERMEDEDNLKAVWDSIAMDAQDDYGELGFIDSGLAAAFSPVYNARWEAYLNRIEQFKNRLDLLKAGNPRGALGYEELIQERNRRKGI